MRITTPENDIQKVLFTQEQINARVKEMGAALAEEYRGKQPLMVCILKGAIFGKMSIQVFGPFL